MTYRRIGWIELLRSNARSRRLLRATRKDHNDRDFSCRYWWGDRGGYDLRAERCWICNPRGK